MTDREQRELLIDFAEGTLPKEREQDIKRLFEDHPEYREDLEIVQSVFQSLQQLPTETVPEYYFSNFLPRLRNTIENRRISHRWSYPPFVQSFLQPSLVVIIVVLLMSLYESFKPETVRSQIYDLVNQIEQNEINTVIGEPVFLSALSTEDIMESKIDREYFGIEGSFYQSESELLASLEVTELEQVVEHLENRSIE